MDTTFVVEFFEQTMRLRDASLSSMSLRSCVIDAYEVFVDEILTAFRAVHSVRGSLEIQQIDAFEVSRHLHESATGLPAITLHPLAGRNALRLQTSRLYEPGGTVYLGPNQRPGTKSIETQLAYLKSQIKNQPIVLLDDDCFSGETLSQTVKLCQYVGIEVAEARVGISVGKGPPQRLLPFSDLGFSSLIHVNHERAETVELVDMRDFLLGVCGLVVHLGNGEIGRVPYFSPFVSASARASIPAGMETEFAIKVIDANDRFFHTLQRSGFTIHLANTDPSFQLALSYLFGFRESNLSARAILIHIRDAVDTGDDFVRSGGRVA